MVWKEKDVHLTILRITESLVTLFYTSITAEKWKTWSQVSFESTEDCKTCPNHQSTSMQSPFLAHFNASSSPFLLTLCNNIQVSKPHTPRWRYIFPRKSRGEQERHVNGKATWHHMPIMAAEFDQQPVDLKMVFLGDSGLGKTGFITAIRRFSSRGRSTSTSRLHLHRQHTSGWKEVSCSLFRSGALLAYGWRAGNLNWPIRIQ